MFAATDRRLAALSVDAWLEALASDQPAPGGGAAAALAAAAAAALIEMVCRFSTGREQFTAWAEQIATSLTMAGQLRRELLATMDADADAFAAVTAAYGLPRSDKQERALRRQLIDDALAAAAAPPLQVAATAATLAELALALVGRTNAQLVSDLGAAGALLAAALRIAGYNVEANTRALKVDPRAAALHEQLTATQGQAEQHLGALRASVEQALGGDRLP
jgi:formiminotetrahydrofolate cyclodeaminase